MTLPPRYDTVLRLGADGQHQAVDVWSAADMRAAINETVRMRARIEGLRGLCKTAVGLLHDAGRDADADRVHALIGDMEPGI